MSRLTAIVLMASLLPASACAQEGMTPAEMIASAISAGPASISDAAAVMDWDMNEIRGGTNGWTCLPDRADTESLDPWCVYAPWLDLLIAYVNNIEPTYGQIGFAYIGQSSNSA